jgi:acyl carrier protein
MNSTQIVLAAIAKVAPDVDVEALDHQADLREEADLDSMDFLHVVTAVHEATGLEIPERDYPQLWSVASFADYVAASGGT